MKRKKLLEIILDENYQGLLPRELAKLIFEKEDLSKSDIAHIQASIGQLVRRGILRRVDSKIFPTDKTLDFYNFIVTYRMRDKK